MKNIYRLKNIFDNIRNSLKLYSFLSPNKDDRIHREQRVFLAFLCFECSPEGPNNSRRYYTIWSFPRGSIFSVSFRKNSSTFRLSTLEIIQIYFFLRRFFLRRFLRRFFYDDFFFSYDDVPRLYTDLRSKIGP